MDCFNKPKSKECEKKQLTCNFSISSSFFHGNRCHQNGPCLSCHDASAGRLNPLIWLASGSLKHQLYQNDFPSSNGLGWSFIMVIPSAECTNMFVFTSSHVALDSSSSGRSDANTKQNWIPM